MRESLGAKADTDVRLSWNEVRDRSFEFSKSWKDAEYEKGETQSFYNDFFEIFGVRRRSVASYEKYVKKLNNKHGFIDLFWPNVLLVEQKSAGKNLSDAVGQAGDYFSALEEWEKPRYLMVSDFQNFEVYDLDERTEVKFTLQQLPDHIEHFAFILGIQKRKFRDQDPVNIKAAELVGKLHDALEDSGYEGESLEKFLVRVVFCVFADDTGIFEPRDLFLDLLENRTSEDGSDVGMWLVKLFEILDMPTAKRSNKLDEDLARFPYVNGDLFKGATKVPDFDSGLRKQLLEVCRFDWTPISPAIFGSLFQSILNREERRRGGAHYTTELNIMKVIHDLFLDDLYEEFETISSMKTKRIARLREFQGKLGSLRFLDPACGCGNFLVITYRELRTLELEVLKQIYAGDDQLKLDLSVLSLVNVDQFHGIEILEFPARIAATAMWMMDHIMNNRLSLEFGRTYARIPLKATPHIVNSNALRVDWAAVVAPSDKVYVLGNPPFVGKHLRSEEQEADMRLFEADVPNGLMSLDYVSAWYLKAANYMQGNQMRCALVSTNSITQGEQVATLWKPLLQKYGLRIDYAHRTFAWGSDARGKAQVHCVIIGFSNFDVGRQKFLYNYPDVKGNPDRVKAKHISPYLIDHDAILVEGESKPLWSVPEIKYGSKPVDNGYLLLDDDEKKELELSSPGIGKFIRPLVSAKEFLSGANRWCLWLKDENPKEYSKFPEIRNRLAEVKAFRLASEKKPTRDAAAIPAEFAEIRQPGQAYVLVPLHTSEKRDYVPFGFFDKHTILHNSCACIVGAGLYEFGVLISAMHMAWLRHVGGKIKSDYRYSNRLVYNTFPWPKVTNAKKKVVEKLAQAVLDERRKYPDSSLSNLYDPVLMPGGLLRCHRRLDRAVEKLYSRGKLDTDLLRAQSLFQLYNDKANPPMLDLP